MTIGKLPLVMAVGGLAIKLLLILTWHLAPVGWLLTLITTYDPISFQVAEILTRSIFDPRRIAPGTPESLTFEALLIVTFALQCLLLGIAIRMGIQYRRRTE